MTNSLALEDVTNHELAETIAGVGVTWITSGLPAAAAPRGGEIRVAADSGSDHPAVMRDLKADLE